MYLASTLMNHYYNLNFDFQSIDFLFITVHWAYSNNCNKAIILDYGQTAKRECDIESWWHQEALKWWTMECLPWQHITISGKCNDYKINRASVTWHNCLLSTVPCFNSSYLHLSSLPCFAFRAAHNDSTAAMAGAAVEAALDVDTCTCGQSCWIRSRHWRLLPLCRPSRLAVLVVVVHVLEVLKALERLLTGLQPLVLGEVFSACGWRTCRIRHMGTGVDLQLHKIIIHDG